MGAIQINSVGKIYPNGTRALEDVNIEINDGEFVVLVGPSGCGKTTLLRMVAGLEDITEGEISIGEKIVNEVAPKDRDIAMVFQNYALYPHMSVYDNMAFSLKLRKLSKNEIDEKVKEAAKILEIDELLEKSGLGRDKIILELGSGEGQFLKPLSLNHKQVIALDTSETLLQKAQKFTRSEGLSNIEFVVGDTSTFRAQETVVDAVIMNMVLHHVPAPSKIFEDCYSFLSNGGVMVVCDLSHHHQDWAKDRCGDLWLGFEPQELTSWAQRVGFEEDESVFIGLRNGFQIQLRKFVKPLLSKATQSLL